MKKNILILASHGSLAEGMKNAAEAIMGEEENLFAYGLEKYETPQRIARLVDAQIGVPTSVRALILCDIKGGSVANELLPQCRKEGVRMLTGMNLPMVIELMTDLDGEISNERVDEIISEARDGVCYFDANVLTRLLQVEEDSDEVL